MEPFPERDAERRRLRALLSGDGPTIANVVVWGRPRSGKASVVRAVMEDLGRDYAWLTCCLTDTSESVLSRFLQKLRPSSAPRHPTVRSLHDALRQWCPRDRAVRHLVVDHPEALTAAPTVLELLLCLEEDPEIRVGVVFVAQTAEEWLPVGTCRPPIAVAFRSYTPDEVTAIMTRRFLPSGGDDALSRQFFEGVTPTLMRCTTDVLTLQSCLEYLFAKFWEPARTNANGRGSRAPLSETELKRRVMSYVVAVLSALNRGHVSDLQHVLQETPTRERPSITASPGLHSTGLPVYSKVMLLAGYLCSYNRPEYDLVLFDPTNGAKRKRTACVRGKPGLVSFEYERHFMMSQQLVRVVDPKEKLDPLYTHLYSSQFATLEAFDFIRRMSGDVLKTAKYVCTVDADFAKQLADGLKINLPDFLEH